ncbi:sel1 repeat family protein [Acidovorax sp. SUPP950]|uniref:tetratricopeptide repeat protein n=1 Tax=Acidovorax sp. SUPP950 TaxID=511901 RepID=UPI0023CE78D2|nr:tetratricopeptide repeat protein [Acidovorax sp. SUPP950]GKS73898.1 sel1 repeat family protein [Acidovorax sp. SUPP950]
MNASDLSLEPVETPEAARAAAVRVCPRCSHTRQATDTAPAWQCPRCEVAYDKVLPTSVAARQKPEGARARPAAAPGDKPWTLIVLAGGVVVLMALMGWKWNHDKAQAAERIARAESDARALQIAAQREGMEQLARLGAAETQWRRGQGLDVLPTVRAMAQQGHLRAMVLLSAMLDEGNGIPRDHAESMQWLTRAAHQGSSLAAVRLGAIYQEGRGGEPRQMSLTENWYLRAARQGDAAGLYRLGDLYANGAATVAQRPVAAYMLLELADRLGRGNPEDPLTLPRYGAVHLQLLARRMGPVDIAEARRRADAWKPGQPLDL